MHKLTSRERLDRCYRHKETDRPGLFIRGVGDNTPPHASYKPLCEMVLSGCDLKNTVYLENYKDITGHLFKKEYYTDEFERYLEIVHTPEGDLYKSSMVSLKGKPGYVEKHLIESLDDVEKYLLLPERKLIFDPETYFEADRNMGDRGIVVAEIGLNPAGSVAELLGSELFAIWSIEHRDVLHVLMEHEKNMIIKIVKSLLDWNIGPYFAMLGEEYITPPLHCPKDFYDFNVIYDKEIIDIIHESGGYIHIHSHGPLKNVLKYFIEMGTDILHPIEAPPMGDVTLRDAKDVLGNKVCIEGNIQIGDMYAASPDKIREMASQVIDEAFDDSKGLIVCPTASPYVTVLDENTLKNYEALIDTVLNYNSKG